MADAASEERYRARWRRSVPALEDELAAIEALYQAEAEAGMNPDPESDARVTEAKEAWQAAKRAYERATYADKKEQRAMAKMPATVAPALQRIAKLRDTMVDLLDTLNTTPAAWSEPGYRQSAAKLFLRLSAMAQEAAEIADPKTP